MLVLLIDLYTVLYQPRIACYILCVVSHILERTKVLCTVFDQAAHARRLQDSVMLYFVKYYLTNHMLQ